MLLNRQLINFFTYFFISFSFSGCGLTGNIIGDWTDTSSMEQYGDEVYETLVVLRTYIGKHKDDIVLEFGEPHEVEKRAGSKAVLYQDDRIKFDEIWEYTYSRGFALIYSESSVKYFFFKDDIVVEVSAH